MTFNDFIRHAQRRIDANRQLGESLLVVRIDQRFATISSFIHCDGVVELVPDVIPGHDQDAPRCPTCGGAAFLVYTSPETPSQNV